MSIYDDGDHPTLEWFQIKTLFTYTPTRTSNYIMDTCIFVSPPYGGLMETRKIGHFLGGRNHAF